MQLGVLGYCLGLARFGQVWAFELVCESGARQQVCLGLLLACRIGTSLNRETTNYLGYLVSHCELILFFLQQKRLVHLGFFRGELVIRDSKKHNYFLILVIALPSSSCPEYHQGLWDALLQILPKAPHVNTPNPFNTINNV